MKKPTNKQIIITSLLCLIPLIYFFALYDKLPSEIAIHWNANGEVDNYANKLFVGIGFPIILAIAHFGLNRISNNYENYNARSSIMLYMINMYLIPILSNILIPISFVSALGYDVPIMSIAPMIVGLLFMFIGNYSPKTRQNTIVGIRIPWTLDNEDNWNKTHRITGYLWLVSGFIICILAFVQFFIDIPIAIIFLIILAIDVIVPFAYSYNLSKK